MALKLTVTTPHGFDAVDAYHRAECPQIGRDKSTACAMLRSYKTGADGESFFAEHAVEFEYSGDGGSIYAQAYEAAKKLEAFKDAVDC